MRVSSLIAVARARVTKTPVPLAVGFELTHRCNLACDYCDRHRQLPNEMTLDQILDSLDGLRQIGMREISLDGGEALTHRHVGVIAEWLDCHGIVTRLNTNGVLVPRHQDVIRRCAKVKISLDGPEAVHDRARGKGAYHRAIQGALVAGELGGSRGIYLRAGVAQLLRRRRIARSCARTRDWRRISASASQFGQRVKSGTTA
jgi:MoaA/NifB/PqqE/SkfB family radical SAM enzyme